MGYGHYLFFKNSAYLVLCASLSQFMCHWCSLRMWDFTSVEWSNLSLPPGKRLFVCSLDPAVLLGGQVVAVSRRISPPYGNRLKDSNLLRNDCPGLIKHSFTMSASLHRPQEAVQVAYRTFHSKASPRALGCCAWIAQPFLVGPSFRSPSREQLWGKGVGLSRWPFSSLGLATGY